MALETEAKHLDFATVEAGCLNMILKPKWGVYYMADLVKDDGTRMPIGCTMVSFEM